MRSYFFGSYFVFGAIIIYLALFVWQLSHDIVVGGAVLVALALAFWVERKIPYGLNFEEPTYKRDAIYTIINIFFLMIVGPLSIVSLTLMFRFFLGDFVLFHHEDLGSIYLQAFLVFLFVDKGRYWIHRAQHKFDFLWKFHAQHHSVRKIYSGNNFYSHPLDLFVRHGIPGYVAAAVGFHPMALGFGLSLLALIGIFSHCDANFNFGVLNKWITTNEVHRWHHSSEFGPEGKNFAPSLSFWDRLFGTYYLEQSRKGPSEMGLGADEENYPVHDMWQFTLYPFLKK